jgi:hypothetical protein
MSVPFPLPRPWLFAVALATVITGTARADATDERALVVVIEGTDQRVDVGRLRIEIGAALDLPVVSMLESSAREPTGMLAVAITEHGRRAAIQFIPADGRRYATMIDVRATGPQRTDGSWLIAPCTSIVRTSNERRAADASEPALDPWIANHSIPVGATVDPWAGLPRSASRVWVTDYYVADEIENPWAQAVTRLRDEEELRASRPSRRRVR